jgi:hypothetical protein
MQYYCSVQTTMLCTLMAKKSVDARDGIRTVPLVAVRCQVPQLNQSTFGPGARSCFRALTVSPSLTTSRPTNTASSSIPSATCATAWRVKPCAASAVLLIKTLPDAAAKRPTATAATTVPVLGNSRRSEKPGTFAKYCDMHLHCVKRRPAAIDRW